LAKKSQLDLFSSRQANLLAKQQWLLEYRNPLKDHLGAEFFSSIPKTPGVYKFFDRHGALLYVGKAKSLRERLRSYTYATPEASSRKVLRMVQLIERVEWELLASEKEALLRENELLRNLKPQFNDLNTSPHTYLFQHLRLEQGGIRFHTGMNPGEIYPNGGDLLGRYDDCFGAFKSRKLVFQTQKSILRILFAVHYDCGNGLSFPGRYMNRKKIEHHLFRTPSEVSPPELSRLYKLIRRFYAGISPRLIAQLAENLAKRNGADSFVCSLLKEDLAVLEEFYERCARRNSNMRKKLGLSSRLIEQGLLDDYAVLSSDRYE
jgi:hypothetical protein